MKSSEIEFFNKIFGKEIEKIPPTYKTWYVKELKPNDAYYPVISSSKYQTTELIKRNFYKPYFIFI